DLAQAGARGDAQLGVDLVQVVADRVPAQEQPAGDLLVGQPLAGQLGDPQLLCGEPGPGAGVERTGGLAAGPQLGPDLLGPGRRAQPFVQLQGNAQVAAGLGPPARAPE